MLWGISERVCAIVFKPSPLCSAPPENLLIGISGALGMKESHFLSKICFGKMLWGISEMVNARAFKTFAIVFCTAENLLIEISGAVGMKESHFLSKICFGKMLWGISEMVNARAFKPLPLCSAPLKTILIEISGALGMKESHFLRLKHDLRKCCGVSQKDLSARASKPLPLVFSTAENLLIEISGALGMKESHFLR